MHSVSLIKTGDRKIPKNTISLILQLPGLVPKASKSVGTSYRSEQTKQLSDRPEV